MRKTLIDPAQDSLYNSLIELGAAEKRATELQNIATLLSYTSCNIDNIECSADFNIATSANGMDICTAYQNAQQNHTTLVVLHPYLDRARREICRKLVEIHTSTSVDNRGYLIFFNNHLPKQHYRL
jgi:hypothetical protein